MSAGRDMLFRTQNTMFRARSDVFWAQNNARATRSSVFRVRNNVFWVRSALFRSAMDDVFCRRTAAGHYSLDLNRPAGLLLDLELSRLPRLLL